MKTNLYRGFDGKLAEVSRTGEPVPCSYRGINWWHYGSSFEDAVMGLDLDIDCYYGNFNEEDNNGKNIGVIIERELEYEEKDGWIIFPEGWGIGHKNDDQSEEVLKERGWKERDCKDFIKRHGVEYRNKNNCHDWPEIMFNRFPDILSEVGANGIVSTGDIKNYKIFKDFSN